MTILMRVRAATVFFIEARLDETRPWKQITDGVEWPPYKDEKKASRVVKELLKETARKRV